jgi:hypothetical protein
VFSGAEPVNPFSLQEWGNGEQKMECADSEEPVFKSQRRRKQPKRMLVDSFDLHPSHISYPNVYPLLTLISNIGVRIAEDIGAQSPFIG